MNGNGTHQPAGDPGVPVDNVSVALTGTGTLLDRNGRGARNGRPYGEQLETEAREVAIRYRFWPGAAGRLRAATRKALGRG
jgi:hypothetical protein